MGAFYISPKGNPISDKVFDLFKEKGFSNPLEFELSNIKLLIYKKQLFDSINYVEEKKSKMFVVGTCFYVNEKYEEGLKRILSDFINNKLNQKKILGSYFILFYHEEKVSFITDPGGIQNVFYNNETGIISSSFLAGIIGVSENIGKLKINREALAEILVTGSLIGSETMVNEIQRFLWFADDNLPNISKAITLNQPSSDNEKKGYNSPVEAAAAQNLILLQYLESIKNVLDDIGVASGLSGGLDSRLLYLALKRKTSNYSIYTTSRHIQNIEVKIAERLTDSAGDKLIKIPYKSYIEKKEKELNETLYENFIYNDGLIRTYQLWHEEIKGKKYIHELYKEKRIGFSGIGGEQYRNSHFLSKRRKYNLPKFIFFELIYRHSGNPFISRKNKNQLVKYIEGKIRKNLNLTEKSHISFVNIMRFYNEVYNVSNRTTRNNIENQSVFFLSPFADYFVSQKAYNAIPYLGMHYGFEKHMLKQLSPELSNVNTDHGFAAADRSIPIRYSLVFWLKNLAGLELYNRIYYKLKRNKGKTYHEMIMRHKHLKIYIDKIKQLDLGIDIQKLSQSNLVFPMVLETGFFINQMEPFLKIEDD